MILSPFAASDGFFLFIEEKMKPVYDSISHFCTGFKGEIAEFQEGLLVWKSMILERLCLQVVCGRDKMVAD